MVSGLLHNYMGAVGQRREGMLRSETYELVEGRGGQ
jgi:hypothetical protein